MDDYAGFSRIEFYQRLGYVGEIALILDKYLGAPKPVDDEMSTIDTDLYIDFGGDVYRIMKTNGINHWCWNTKQTSEHIEQCKLHFRELVSSYNALPFPIQWHFEMQATKRLEQHPKVIGKFEPSIPNMPISYLISCLESLIEIDVKSQDITSWDTTAFETAIEANKPWKDINLPQSEDRFRKVLIISKLRKLWEIQKEKTAPKSIPYEGSDFGDMLGEIFLVLRIDADVRAAVDAWRTEMADT